MPGLALALASTFVLAPIDWRAPTPCPDAAEVGRRARALGTEVATLRVAGEVSAGSDGTFVLQLAIDEAPPRRYVARDCDSLADVAALVLALASDPVAVALRSEAIGPRPVHEAVTSRIAAPDHAPAPHEPAPKRPVVPVPPRSRVEGFARVHASFGIAELPRFDTGLGVAFGIGAGPGRFELHVAHLFARTAAVPSPGDVTAVIASWNFSPRGCAVLGRGSVRAALCAGPELGLVTADGRGLADNDRALALWIAAIAAPGFEWTIRPRLQLHAGVEMVAALRRPRFAARERPDDHVTLGAGGLRAILGLAGQFGPAARVRAAR